MQNLKNYLHLKIKEKSMIKLFLKPVFIVLPGGVK